ncbi:ATP-dependent DNA helicase [Frankliniella fusca]|uniref:ATP-dependent DNA helicase n=1 Tax=Frankliniella fusca TaxID=407009 RepID=A0AAE1LXJ5_9NEOP|nr:ATP-dependent DNA helicase [Frankliniella fusca]
MDPGDVPEALSGLTFIEEQLISKIRPIISVFKLKGHQYGYRGNEIASQLPHRVEDLDNIICVKFENKNHEYYDFQVRADKVRNALIWLKANNTYYKDIVISEENISVLPCDGNVIDRIQFVSSDDLVAASSDSDEKVHESFVPNVSQVDQDHQIKKKLKWPTTCNEPIDEFNTPGYIACAFPTLFPRGEADLRVNRLAVVKPANYFKHLMNFHDNRFAQHKTFRFFAYNSRLRWTAMNDGNIFVKNNKEFQNMTTGQLKNLILENKSIMSHIMYYGSNIPGTKAYWHNNANKLRDMVEQLGLPSIFLTMSCADGHWNDLYRLMSDVDPSTLSEKERRDLVQNNPHIVDSFFDFRIKTFLNQVMEKKFKVVDYWYRIEYQHRGSPHLHGLFWIDGAPDLTDIENFTEEQLMDVIDYYSELVEAWNPNVSESSPDTHPCRVSYSMVEDFEVDLAQLLHKVQRHTNCTEQTCFKKFKENGLRQCRFGFPITDMNEKASIGKNEKGEFQFVPKRNDPRLNKFNKFIIQLWRANIDIAPVISRKAVIAYLCKYVSKCEISSLVLHDLFRDVANKLNDDDKAKRVIHKVLMRSCAERDISAQEECHTLLGLQLWSAGGRQFVNINLSEKKWLAVCEDDEDDVIGKSGKSIVEKYSDRPDSLEHISLWQCARNYNTRTWKVTKQHTIVRVFPYLKKIDVHDENEDYYRQQVLLHMPWRDFNLLKNPDETWLHVFNSNGIEDKLKTMHKLSADYEPEEEFDEEINDLDSDDEEEFQILSRLGPQSTIPSVNLGNRDVDLNYQWQLNSMKYEQFGTLPQIENFIDNAKKIHVVHDNSNVLSKILPFSNDQQDVIDLVQKQIDHCLGVRNESVKRFIVQGKAGTGKSFIINHIRSMILNSCGQQSLIVGTPTGVSAMLIKGRTLQSIFKIPRKTAEFKDLKSEAARKLQTEMKDVNFLIIDEYSMVGCQLLAMIDQRCKQGKGNSDPFGGMNVIMFGDIKQLAHVKDNPFYSKVQLSVLGKKGKVLIESFDKVCFLTTCHRQKDASFLDLLDKVSNGDSTKEDYNVLSSRFSTNVSNKDLSDFDNAIHIFSTKEEVKNYNYKKLGELIDPDTGNFCPVMKINAKHNCASAKVGSIEDAEGLEPSLRLARGAKVMLRCNLWVEMNLVNGSIGTVHDIILLPHLDFPSVILVEFPCYTGPDFIPGTKIIPIKPVLRSWLTNNNTCTRYQFPVTLSYACSIHKSQGMTLEKAFINIGPREFSLGLAYVALSRARNLNGFVIHPFMFDRITSKIKAHPHMHLRQEFLMAMRNKDY